ncbi:hypothetical protein QTH97_34535 [Variovorax sp. J22R24]|nr:hypothetical protein [Variovorax sp. J22R24]MDM0110064.1 hypothetical protein [Variovorax sp. J22R24]
MQIVPDGAAREALATDYAKMLECVFQGIVDARFSRSWTAFQMNVDAVSG